MTATTRLAVGVISGTSMDGVDVAAVSTDGVAATPFGQGLTHPYPPDLRAELLAVVADPARAEHDPLTDLEARVTAAHGDAVARFLDASAVRPTLIGLHGQTIWHRPERRITRQLGDGATIARRFAVETVDRFRHADVAAGGEGAPFAPLYHAALAAPLAWPLVVLNLGGVGNVTYIADDLVMAFDTGPASAPLDDFVARRRGLAFDADGGLAASGRVDARLLARLMDTPYFNRPPPKSLDRNDFHGRAAWVDGLDDADGAATLAAFTIAATVAARRHFPAPERRWLVTGGGRRNGHFMRGLATALGVPVEPVEAVGWNGDHLEAECFAFLAMRSVVGLPLSLPTTTGVPRPMTGGRLSRP
jgi:anhydro-N-acetylmuramic acid kinase